MVKTQNSDVLGLKTYPKEAWKIDFDWDLKVRGAIQQRINTYMKPPTSHPLLDLGFGFPGALCHRFFEVRVGVPEFLPDGLAA